MEVSALFQYDISEILRLTYPVAASVKEQSKPIDSSRASLESSSSAEKGTAEFKASSGATSPIDPGSARLDHDGQAEGAPLSPRTSKGKPVAPGSLATALKGSLSRSLSRSPSRSSSPSRHDSHHNRHHHRRDSNSVAGQISLEAAIGAGKGVGRIVGAGLKSPMDFTLGLARGFHNAPKLYGDQSVRQADKVTDFQSGLKAAGKVGPSSLSARWHRLMILGIWLWLLRRDIRTCDSASRGCKERRRCRFA